MQVWCGNGTPSRGWALRPASDPTQRVQRREVVGSEWTTQTPACRRPCAPPVGAPHPSAVKHLDPANAHRALDVRVTRGAQTVLWAQ